MFKIKKKQIKQNAEEPKELLGEPKLAINAIMSPPSPRPKILDEPRITINPRIYDQEIYVNPCAGEHWISTDLFKFKLYAEENQLHVVGFCSKNYVPHYSLFCDEIILTPVNHELYDGYTIVGLRRPRGLPVLDLEATEGLRATFSMVPDEKVLERFKNRRVYIFKSAYDKFQKLELPKDVIMCEVKEQSKLRGRMLEMDLPLVGLDYTFQKNLIEEIGTDSFMAIQILGSKFLNWQFFCCGGSSNLTSVIPVKSIFMRDRTINESVAKIVKGFSLNNEVPFIVNLFARDDAKFIEKHVKQDMLSHAFEVMSNISLNFEIVLIED